MLLAITSDTWLVTGLGFGVVLALLICLVFILKLFGWIMQTTTAPKAPKAPKEKPQSAPTPVQSAPSAPSPEEQAAIGMALSAAHNDDIAAVAYALYLAKADGKHDIPTAMIPVQARETAWNTKSYGLNNVGF